MQHKNAVSRKPQDLTVTAPEKIFCWNITSLSTQVLDSYFYLYWFMDLFSWKIVGWQVYEAQSAAFAGAQLQDI